MSTSFHELHNNTRNTHAAKGILHKQIEKGALKQMSKWRDDNRKDKIEILINMN
jgi:hypothetical protein